MSEDRTTANFVLPTPFQQREVMPTRTVNVQQVIIVWVDHRLVGPVISVLQVNLRCTLVMLNAMHVPETRLALLTDHANATRASTVDLRLNLMEDAQRAQLTLDSRPAINSSFLRAVTAQRMRLQGQAAGNVFVQRMHMEIQMQTRPCRASCAQLTPWQMRTAVLSRTASVEKASLEISPARCRQKYVVPVRKEAQPVWVQPLLQIADVVRARTEIWHIIFRAPCVPTMRHHRVVRSSPRDACVKQTTTEIQQLTFRARRAQTTRCRWRIVERLKIATASKGILVLHAALPQVDR